MSDYRTIVFSENHCFQLEDRPAVDIDRDSEFSELFHMTRNYSMTSKDTMYAQYCAVKYLLDRDIPGDLVECGVWRGGSSLLAALLLKRRQERRRRLYLYDTYAGMTSPTDVDVDIYGVVAADRFERKRDDRGWCYASLEDVKNTFDAHEFAFEISYIKGPVEQTLKRDLPEQIALLRLDTDWYESTLVELEQLYPKISPGGVVIIDDYGHWDGARQATDEYFATVPAPLLVRVNYAVRLAIKV